jgi:hypothetical protein
LADASLGPFEIAVVAELGTGDSGPTAFKGSAVVTAFKEGMREFCVVIDKQFFAELKPIC